MMQQGPSLSVGETLVVTAHVKTLHPLPPDKPPHQQFSSLRTQHDQWKSQHDQQGAEAEQRLRNYVQVQ